MHASSDRIYVGVLMLIFFRGTTGSTAARMYDVIPPRNGIQSGGPYKWPQNGRNPVEVCPNCWVVFFFLHETHDTFFVYVLLEPPKRS